MQFDEIDKVSGRTELDILEIEVQEDFKILIVNKWCTLKKGTRV